MSALLQGRAQQDTDKRKLSPLKRRSTDIGGDGYECLSACFLVCVCVPPFPWGEKISYLGGGGEKNRPIWGCKCVPEVRTDARPPDLPAATRPTGIILDWETLSEASVGGKDFLSDNHPGYSSMSLKLSDVTCLATLLLMEGHRRWCHKCFPVLCGLCMTFMTNVTGINN